MQLDSFLSTYTKPKFKWIKELQIKPDELNLMKEILGQSLEHIDTWEIFLNRTSMVYTPRSPIDKWDLIKLQRYCKAVDSNNRTKQQPIELEKIITNRT